MSKKAMKLALEALEYHQEQTRPIAKTKKTIAFLRAEIAKQECNCKQGQQCHICDPITIAKQEQGEPVAWYTEDHLTDRSATTYSKDMVYRWECKGWPVTPLYLAPPPCPTCEELAKQEQGEPVAVAWAAFTEACQRVSSPEQSGELRDAIDRMTDAMMERDERAVTPDYVQGHKDGCEWSARLAEASDPRTGDWLYDDPHELAKALRKGPDFGDLDTSPQQRTWVGLTDEEIRACITSNKYAFEIVRAAEAKLKEKNA